jgi:hypothetical protein
MKRFVMRFEDHIKGIVAGPDRLLFRGTLRSISHTEGLERFLRASSILYKDFAREMRSISTMLCQAGQRMAEQKGRRYEYLKSVKIPKEEYAQQAAQQNGIEEGLVCVLACMESCQTFRVRKNREKKKLEIVPHRGQCRHLYFYFLDREFGLMHVRLQTWVPFTIQVCLNGRDWLGCQLQRKQIAHRQQDNCFTEIADVERAQALLDRLPLKRWVSRLSAWARRTNPWLKTAAALGLKPYYWSLRESEYATDIMFHPGELQKIYPLLVRHAIDQFSCEMVLRFLGKRLPARCRSDVRSDMRRGPDGLRVKHWVAENSIKMYDKQGCVLRIETTINNARRFRVRRRNSGGKWVYMPLRKGVADFRRRARICHLANAAYLDALAAVVIPHPTARLLDPLSRPAKRHGRRYRPLRPISPEDASKLQLLAHEAFLLGGVRNRDLQPMWPDRECGTRLASRISRWLALANAHGIIARIARTRRYRITGKGHDVIAAIRHIRQSEPAVGEAKV